MIRIIPDSISIVLRSTHILVIRVDSAAAAEWELQPAGWLQRPLNVMVTLTEILKGVVREHVGDHVLVQATQYRVNTIWTVPTPGVWSEQPLDPGTQLVAFCRTDGDQAMEILRDPACEKLIVTGSALPDVRLASQAESKSLSLSALFERAKPAARSLNYIFAEYLSAAYVKESLNDPEQFETLVQFLEDPDLSQIARSSLLASINSVLLTGTIPPARIHRFVITLFRLLELPVASNLHDNIIGTYLPNLLGLHAEAVPTRAAADVFKDQTEERAKVERILQSYRGASSTIQLLKWLASKQDKVE